MLLLEILGLEIGANSIISARKYPIEQGQPDGNIRTGTDQPSRTEIANGHYPDSSSMILSQTVIMGCKIFDSIQTNLRVKNNSYRYKRR